MTEAEVMALAPDGALAKAGRQLATRSSWPALGIDATVVWGECKGSGATPYRARVELATVGYACSCPSRKFPCKHVIALLLLAAIGSVPSAVPPAWVASWLAARLEKRDRPVASPRATPSADSDASALAAAKRAATREARVAAGIEELRLWLDDLVRLGLARAYDEPSQFWEAKAARLVDAQAPGLARRVRAFAGICASGRGWEARLLDAVGGLYLLCEAYDRIATSGARRADVRRYVGWTQREDETILRDGASIADTWTVLGTRSEEDERLTVHRAWLRGTASGRDALVVQFEAPGASIGAVFVPGTSVRAKLAYFEASVPQRVAIAERGESMGSADALRGKSFDDALTAYAECVALDPWFETLADCFAVRATALVDDEWYAVDAAGRALPIARSFANTYELHALAGGHPLVLAAEWNGRALQPLGTWADGRYVSLR